MDPERAWAITWPEYLVLLIQRQEAEDDTGTGPTLESADEATDFFVSAAGKHAPLIVSGAV